MALKFSELSELERVLVAAGSSRDRFEELDQATTWLSGEGIPEEFYEPIVRLAEVARSATKQRAVEIATGALVFVRRELATDSGRCLAALRFAQQRVESLEIERGFWTSVTLGEREEADARALFEAAIGDRSYSERDLVEAAQEFVRVHGGENSIFGRLAFDLEFLIEVMQGSATVEAADIAKAALIYFAEVADAVPDDLGLVGLIDDAYIVQQAVDMIRPERGHLVAYTENRVRRWRFLRNFEFELDGRRTGLSDYMCVNSALVLDVVESESSSTIVLLSKVGPLPYLLGFVAAVARISDATNLREGVLEHGDWLIDRDGKGEVRFDTYLRQEEHGTFVSCVLELATHARVIEPSRRNASEVIRTFRVTELGNFRRTALGGDKRKRSDIRVNVGDREVGSLELLLGRSKPLILESRLPVVLVVAPVEETKQLSEELVLFGTPVRDVVPTGQLNRVDGGLEVGYWSKYGIGGEPLLCIARTLEEAYQAVVLSPFEGRKVSTVIAQIRPGSPDASQIVRFASLGVSVLACAAPEDSETLEIFQDRDVSFWFWDSRWLNVLYWPQFDATARNPLIEYEKEVREGVLAESTVEEVPFDEISKLTVVLVALGSRGDADDESLHEWISRAWWLLVRFCQWFTPMSIEANDQFNSEIERLASMCRSNQYRWPQESLAEGMRIVELFNDVFMELRRHNPKLERLISLARGSSECSILVAERERARCAEAMADMNVRVVSRVASMNRQGLRIIPAWRGKSKMENILFSSAFEKQLLLLYEPEVEWLQKTRRRRERSISRAKELAARKSAIVINGHEKSTERHDLSGVDRFGDVDEVFKSAIYNDVRRSHRDATEKTSATVIGFVGGSWAAFTPMHRIVVASHLIGAEKQGGEIESTTVSNLGAGDILLLLHGSDRDAVRERANLSLSEETVRAADAWKFALQRHARANPNIADLRQRLLRCGCSRSVPTIQSWISDEYVIGPQNAESVIPAIALATNSEELKGMEKECTNAIGAVRSAHVTAGKWLAKQVVERAKEWTDVGAAPDDVVELEDRLVLAEVDFIDVEQILVSVSVANRLQTSAWNV